MSGNEQWVNLEKNSVFVDKPEIKSEESLREKSFEYKFKKAKLAGFKVKVYPLGGQADYVKKERKRNPNFRVQMTQTATNEGKMSAKLERNVFFAAAGGNKYKIKAKYKKKVVEGTKVYEVRRMLFYQVMHMKSVKTGDTSKVEPAFWNDKKNFFIKMKKKGPDAGIDYQKTIDMNKKAAHYSFIAAAGKKYTLKYLHPYAFAIAFVNYLAAPGNTTIKRKVDINIPSKISSWNWNGLEHQLKIGQFLWFGLDDTDDANKSWLISGNLSFIPDGAKPGEKKTIKFDRNDVQIAGPDYKTYGGKAEVKIRLKEGSISRQFFQGRKGKWEIELKLKTVDGWTNGFAYNGYNLLAIADKVQFEDQKKSTMEYTIVHEIGHKVGMVATGGQVDKTGKPLPGSLRHPNSPPNIYGVPKNILDPRHSGPHCSKGVKWDASKGWSGTSQCVMFGQDGTYVGGTYKGAPVEFCSDCEKAVRKLDLHRDTLVQTGFQYTIG